MKELPGHVHALPSAAVSWEGGRDMRVTDVDSFQPRSQAAGEPDCLHAVFSLHPPSAACCNSFAADLVRRAIR